MLATKSYTLYEMQEGKKRLDGSEGGFGKALRQAYLGIH